MSNKKHNNFIAMIFLVGAICLFYLVVSLSDMLDVIVAMVANTDVQPIFSDWIADLKSGILFVFALAVALAVTVLLITLLFYRKELSRKTLGLLFALPAVIIVWSLISYIPTWLFLNYSNDFRVIDLICRIASLAVISVYAGFTLKSMIKEIEFD